MATLMLTASNCRYLTLNVRSALSYLHLCLKIHENSVDHLWCMHDQAQVAIKTKFCMDTTYSQGEFICFYWPIHYKRLYYNIPLLKNKSDMQLEQLIKLITTVLEFSYSIWERVHMDLWPLDLTKPHCDKYFGLLCQQQESRAKENCVRRQI